MKKNFAAIIALLLALVMTFAACVTDEETPETPPAEYTVTFDTDGGSVIAPVKVKEGEKVSRPADPTKSGWSFAGWYADEGTSTAFDFGKPITGDTTVYAKWNREMREFVVAFDSSGGSAVASQTVREGSTVQEPTPPTRNGYDFEGWYADRDLTVPFIFSTPVTAGFTLYAKWAERVFYTVTFDSNGGSAVASQSVRKGSSAQRPDDPERTDYTFTGWYTDRQDGSSNYDFSRPVNGNITLYAHWSQNFATVTFVLNNGEADLVTYVDKGERLSRPNDPIRSGWVFTGWYSDKNCTLPYDFDAEINDDEDFVYAGWRRLEYYTVLIDTDGGTPVQSQTVAEGGFASAPDVVPEKEGYYFTGWFADEDYTVPFDFATTPIRDDVTVYAGWDDNILVQFDADGGTPLLEQIVINAQSGTVQQPATPERDGYTFGGWYVDAARTVAASFPCTVTADTNFYAKWNDEVSSVTVRFELAKLADNGDLVFEPFSKQPLTVTKGTPVTQEMVSAPGDLTATDVGGGQHTMMFSYWSFREYCKEKTGGDSTPVTEMVLFPIDTQGRDEITLYAVYREIEEDETRATLTIHPNNGASDTVVYGVAGQTIGADLDRGNLQPMYSGPGKEAPVRAGYRVTGYYKTDDLSSDHTEDNVYQVPFLLAEEQNDCYLRWEEVEPVGVIFNYYTVGGGWETASAEAGYNDYIPRPESRFLDGYVFDGWYTERGNYNPETRFDFENTRVTESLISYSSSGERRVTLYAKYIKDGVKIAFDAQGGSAVDSVVLERGSSIGELPTPSRNGYVFDGWYTDPACTQFFSADTAVTGDITLYAAWGGESSDLGLFRFVTADDGYKVALADTVNKASVTELVVPTTYNGLPVVGVQEYGFEDCVNLVSVVLPRTTSIISYHAFENCTSLRTVTVGGTSLREIGFGVFEGCSALEEVEIDGSARINWVYGNVFCDSPAMTEQLEQSDGLYYWRDILMGDNAVVTSPDLEAADGTLTSVSVRAGTRVIAALALENQTMSGFAVPEGVEYIGYMGLPDVKTLSLPSTLRRVNESSSSMSTFAYGIENISVADGNRYYGVEDGCLVMYDGMKVIASELGATSLPDGYEIVGAYAFSHKAIDALTIPSSYYEIMARAFEAGEFTSVVIPDSVGILSSSAFNRCDAISELSIGARISAADARGLFSEMRTESLSTVSVSENNVQMHSESNVVYDSSDGSVIFAPEKLSGDVVIPEGIETLPYDFFTSRDTKSVTSFSFPDSLVEYPDLPRSSGALNIRIGAGAGQTPRSDGGATWEDWLDGKNKIPVEVAAGNAYLSSDENGVYTADGKYIIMLRNKDGVWTISDGVVGVRSGSYVFGPDVLHIGADFGAMDELDIDASFLTQVTVSADNPYYSEKDGIIYTADRTGFVLIPVGLERDTVELPKELTSIPDNAFRIGGVGGVVGPYYGNPEYAGMGIYSPKIGTLTVEEGSQLVSIGAYAFTCSGNPEYESMLYGMAEIGTVDLSAATKLQSVGEYAFALSPELTTVVLPSGTVGVGAFFRCGKLTSVSLGDGVTEIGSRAFYQDALLSDITMPDGLENIGTYAFYGCNALYEDGLLVIGDVLWAANSSDLSGKSVTIPSGVTRIADGVFAQMYLIEEIYIHGGVTEIGSGVVTNDTVLVIVEAASKPEGWADDWIGEGVPVIWDCLNNEVDTNGDIRTVLDGTAYTLHTSDGTASVTGAEEGISEVAIPSSVTYGEKNYTVVNIAEGAFEDNTDVTSLTVGEGVLRIEANAFDGAASLAEVTLPSSIEYIGSFAFSGTALTRTTVYAGVEYGGGAYSGVTTLTEVTVEDGVTAIPSAMFRGCTSLTAIALPAGLTGIGGSAFAESGLQSVKIPSAVEYIDDGAFRDSALASIDLTEASALASVGDYAFEDTQLSSVTVPVAVEYGRNAFDTATLRSLTIEVSGEISALPTGSKAKLETLTFTGGAPTTIADFKASEKFILNSADTFTVVFNPGMTYIGDNAFREKEGLSVAFNDGLTEIGVNAFTDSVFASAFELPDSLVTVGSGAFMDAVIPGELTLPDNLETADNSAFSRAQIQSLTVNGNISYIGSSAFGLKSGSQTVLPEALPYLTYLGQSAFGSGDVVWPQRLTLGSADLGVELTGLANGIGPEELVAYVSKVGDNAVDSVVTEKVTFIGVGENVSVGDNALCFMDALTSVRFENIDSFGTYIFRYDDALTDITIGAGVTEISDGMFRSLPSSNVNIVIEGGDLERIGSYAFYQTNITSFTITEKVKEIGDWAFAETKSLGTVVNNSKVLTDIGDQAFYRSVFTSFDLGPVIENIGAYAFAQVANLVSVTNGSDTLRSIGKYAFSNTALTAFGFNEGLQTVGDFAFYNSDLASAALPSSLSTVGSGIFYGCATDITVPFAEDALPAGWSSSWNNKNTGTVTYTPAS